MINKATVQDIALTSKTVLVRVDYNVPFYPDTIKIADDTRIRASLPTVRYLMSQQCRVVLCSHLGRPMGIVVDKLRMAPVALRLSELLNVPVNRAYDCVGSQVRALVETLSPGSVILLENLRFHAEEESNDPDFAAALALLADVYVNDAFGAAHRSHASTQGVTRFLPSVAGLLMARELEILGDVLDSPPRPFVAILGGAKVSDKVSVLHKFAATVDTMVVGGGMVATFLRAEGYEVGESPVEDEAVSAAGDLVRAASERRLNLIMPVDLVVADSFSVDASQMIVDVTDVPAGWRIMDIGPRTISSFEDVLRQAKTVVWNGPMGVYEFEQFSRGTREIAATLGSLTGVTTVLGGGSTAEAVESLGISSRITHVSTGGGASLEFLEGKTLPGVASLLDLEVSSS